MQKNWAICLGGFSDVTQADAYPNGFALVADVEVVAQEVVGLQ